MKESEQKAAARSFAVRWKGRGDEKQHTQTFWLELLQQVFGVENPFGFIIFEDRVKLEHVSFIDARIPETHVIIEQKTLGKDLTKPIQQSDGTFLTPYQQAKRYADEQSYSKRPRWIVASNFEEFRVYDMEHPGAEPEVILLRDLPQEYYRLQFLVNVKSRDIVRETQVSKEAGEIVGRLYDALLRQYNDPESPETLKSLNKLCVRLVFLLYAESAGVLGRRNMFREYLLLYRERNMRRALLDLFDVLSTPPEERDEYMDAELAAFPYVNGGLFDGEKIKVPPFTPDIIDLLIHQASEQFDWSAISPTIFGAVFESTMNPATRRAGGLHYTSVENIHKVIDPLFLDGLKEELAAAKAERTARNRRARLLAFQERIAGLKFLDPACGSGNFLTETYLSLRRLENEAVKELSGEETVLGFEGEHSPIKVAISQFHGIEINDFAVSVAKAALWIAESQAMQETENIVHRELDFLPLKSYGNIVEGNALRMDWEDVIPKAECRYIMGNPPFVGKGFQTKEQKSDMSEIFQGIKGYGNLDYVTCWYKKATEYMQDTEIQTAFVSTNSICQGIAVPPLWKYLFERGIKINFAHRTFKWNSESYYKAAVYCVIIGFSFLEMSPKFYDGNHPISVQNINAYLLDAPNIIVEGRDKAMYDVPPMIVGSCPADGGGFIISDVDFEKFIKKEPLAKKFIHPYIGSEELINGKMRYCLWLKDCTPTELDKMPHVLERVQSVKTFRESSKKEQTRRRAETPTLFTEDRYVERPSIFMPQVSSEKRKYIPIGFMDASVIASNLVYFMPNASLYHFGILTSNVHMAWMKVFAGRLEMRYRYNANIVYNNFPWPSPTPQQKERINKTAQEILDARAKFPEATLSILYNDLKMPPDLRKAHQANDRAVMAAYGFDVKTMTEAACVAELMKMYREMATQS